MSLVFDPAEEHVHLMSGGAMANGVNILIRTKQDGTSTKVPIMYTMVYRDTPHNCELILYHGIDADEPSKIHCASLGMQLDKKTH